MGLCVHVTEKRARKYRNILTKCLYSRPAIRQRDMGILESILTAVSLCADCFAVALCSSVTLKKIDWKDAGRVAVAFALIQTALLLIGWLFGNLFAGMVHTVSHIIGCILLLYVGGSMLLEGIRGGSEERNLNGLKNIIIGGIATSIDALAIGVAQSMGEGSGRGAIVPLAVSVAAVTLISVIAGILGGKTIGQKCGRVAEIAGGLVLAGIGISFLF